MEENNYFRSVFKGTVGAIVFSLVGVIILSQVMTKCKISSNIRSMILVITVLVSLSIGSIVAARKNGCKGMLVGGGVGLSFYLVYFMCASILNSGVSFSLYDFGKLVVLVVIGAIAGILGINI